MGLLKEAGDEDVGARVATYAKAGAAAVSILTEPSRFDGSLDDLARGRARARAAARAGDAQGFPRRRLPGARRPCRRRRRRARHPAHDCRARISSSSSTPRSSCDMFVLLEAFDAPDIELAHALVDCAARAPRPAAGRRELARPRHARGRARTARCARGARCPRDVKRVAESGVATAADAARTAACGYDLALVGSALMSAPDPRALARAMLARSPRGRGTRARADRSRRDRQVHQAARSAAFIKICGMTTPPRSSTRSSCEVDAIGFVFAASVRRVTPQRANELAAARAPQDCLRGRHATSDAGAGERDPARLQAGHPADRSRRHRRSFDLPRELSVLPVMRPGPRPACELPRRILFEGPVSGSGQHDRLGRRRRARAALSSSSSRAASTRSTSPPPCATCVRSASTSRAASRKRPA